MDIDASFNQVLEKVARWIDGFVLMLPNLVGAILVAIAFALAARIAGGVVRRTLARVSSYTQVNHLLATVVSLAVLVTGLFVALGVVGLDKTVTSLLAGVGIIGLALGFAFQNIAANFISGVLLLLRRPFGANDVIRTNDYMGTVMTIDLRATIIRTFEGQLVTIPNSAVLENPIVNFTATGRRRVDIPVGVSYGDDLEKARRVALEALEGIDYRDLSRPLDLYYEGFGDSSINFTVRFWIEFGTQPDYLQARSDAVMRIKAAFDQNGITIPFPIRTLDFAKVGGQTLGDVFQRSGIGNENSGAGHGSARQLPGGEGVRRGSGGADAG
jgi:small conductance mechanosensitive channel